MFEVLVVFVAGFVGRDVGTGFGIAYEMHLVEVVFYAYLADIPQGAQNCRHSEVL